MTLSRIAREQREASICFNFKPYVDIKVDARCFKSDVNELLRADRGRGLRWFNTNQTDVECTWVVLSIIVFTYPVVSCRLYQRPPNRGAVRSETTSDLPPALPENTSGAAFHFATARSGRGKGCDRVDLCRCYHRRCNLSIVL